MRALKLWPRPIYVICIREGIDRLEEHPRFSTRDTLVSRAAAQNEAMVGWIAWIQSTRPL